MALGQLASQPEDAKALRRFSSGGPRPDGRPPSLALTTHFPLESTSIFTGVVVGVRCVLVW